MSTDPEALITDTQIRDLCGGISTMTLWRWRREQGFPRPRKINGRNYNTRREILEHLDALLAAEAELKAEAEEQARQKANAEPREAVLEAATEQLQEIIDNVLSDGHENLLSEAFARNIVERIDAEEPSRITIKF